MDVGGDSCFQNYLGLKCNFFFQHSTVLNSVCTVITLSLENSLVIYILYLKVFNIVEIGQHDILGINVDLSLELFVLTKIPYSYGYLHPGN